MKSDSIMKNNEFNYINWDLNSVKCDTFSYIYPIINKHILRNAEWITSRDGQVKELLNWKTEITNPYRRLVGVAGRNENPFFLLAEAMWIFTGRKDVQFLTLFNGKMADYSDDGQVFHAPYGFRLRHWGVRSEDRYSEENLHAAQGYDQVEDVIRLLYADPNSRQVVMSIWNPDFDLGTVSHDIPCNDMIMFKIRNGRLITTIQNRSNDLHWGLPTNIFQFSFLTEIISACLGIELGIQTHNSQSLHVYEWSDVALRMLEDYTEESQNLYDIAVERKIDFAFMHTLPVNRLCEVDSCLYWIVDNLLAVSRGEKENQEDIEQIAKFSKYLYKAYQYLRLYIQYKRSTEGVDKQRRQEVARRCADGVEALSAGQWENWDVAVLCRNWFMHRSGTTDGIIGTL